MVYIFFSNYIESDEAIIKEAILETNTAMKTAIETKIGVWTRLFSDVYDVLP